VTDVLKSGIAAADRYIADGYLSVRGMSSRFAAIVSAGTMRIQTEHGISGHLAEIGTFEGRYFIALAHALKNDERAIGFDTFVWPDEAVKARLEANLAKHGVTARSIITKADSRKLNATDILSLAPDKKVRFFHIDGEHTPECLSNDLALAVATLDERGVICLDDMLHPGYPTLAVTVDAFLKREEDFRVFCIIDRESMVAAAKYMLCREAVFDFYVEALMQAFPENVWPMGADFRPDKKALVLSLDTRLADIG
jgi:predicted O-methyltransferase YrrM